MIKKSFYRALYIKMKQQTFSRSILEKLGLLFDLLSLLLELKGVA